MIKFKYLTIIICSLTNLTISHVNTASTSTCFFCKNLTENQLKEQIHELKKQNDALITKIQGLELDIATHKRVLNSTEQGKVFAQLRHEATTYRKRVDELEQTGNWGAQRQQYTHNQNQSEMSLKNFSPNGIITQLTMERDALKRKVESLEKSEIAQLNNTYYHQLQDALLEIKKLKEAQYDFCDKVN